jgi:hypothetical protein
MDQIKNVRDQAEAVRAYVRSARLGLEIQNYAAEVKLRAERKAGKVLAECKLWGGDRRSKSHDATLKLSDLGITRDQSSRWQLEASVPDSQFEAYVTRCRHSGKEMTSTALVRLARNASNGKGKNSPAKGESDLADLTASVRELLDQRRRFACIWANPPWCGNQPECPDRLGSAFLRGLTRLAVRDIAAEQAHLHLTVPAGSLCEAMRVIEAWGFVYRSVFVLKGLPQGYGTYWRPAHEFLLLGVRGRLPFRDNSLLGQLEIEERCLARRLGVMRELIERVSPGPYLELFGHQPRPGWTVCREAANRIQDA